MPIQINHRNYKAHSRDDDVESIDRSISGSRRQTCWQYLRFIFEYPIRAIKAWRSNRRLARYQAYEERSNSYGEETKDYFVYQGEDGRKTQ